MTITALSKNALYREAQLSLLGDDCQTTADLSPLDDIIGQDRARQAVEFAMSIKDKGYNIYALGQSGLGKRTMMRRYLKHYEETLDPKNHELFDWCYVSNFADSRKPKLLKLPLDTANNFKKEIEKLMKRLVKALPLAFDNETYYSRADKLKNQLAEKQEAALVELTKEAKTKHISLTMTNQGDYELIALNDDDEPHSADSYDELPEDVQIKFETDISGLEKSLRGIVRQLTEWEEEFTEKQQAHDEQVAREVLNHFFKPLKSKYRPLPQLREYLTAMQKDILENLDIFLEESEEQLAFAYASLDKKMPRRYKINVLVAHDEKTFPIIVEDNPNYHSLFGYIESATYKGTVFTDFSLIRSGSLHKANGGVLMMDAIKVLERPYVWDGLKRALRSKQLDLTSLEREVTLSGTVSLAPEPIPLNLKIILFGDSETYRLLQHYDPDFSELFRVTADFEDIMPRTDEAEYQFARFIASIVHDNQLLPFDRSAIARLIEQSSREADDQTRLSLYSANMAKLVRESHYCAQQAHAKVCQLAHVEQAIKQQRIRVSRLQDEIMQSFKRGTTLIDTQGSAIGQINGLSVLSVTDHQFGVPNRITATTAFGKGEVLDIEYKSKLGGRIHSKGVYILTAYLASILGKTAQIPLTTYLTFEQSYSNVDGDSASMAECCAILSAISEQGIKQHIAITGSMNQFGDVQPIGGVNEKIEGFYDVCVLKGRQDNQGVIIPASNVDNLMLRQDITDAVEKGSFHIWSVNHVTEAIELLTGKAAGYHPNENMLTSDIAKDSIFGIAQGNLNLLR